MSRCSARCLHRLSPAVWAAGVLLAWAGLFAVVLGVAAPAAAQDAVEVDRSSASSVAVAYAQAWRRGDQSMTRSLVTPAERDLFNSLVNIGVMRQRDEASRSAGPPSVTEAYELSAAAMYRLAWPDVEGQRFVVVLRDAEGSWFASIEDEEVFGEDEDLTRPFGPALRSSFRDYANQWATELGLPTAGGSAGGAASDRSSSTSGVASGGPADDGAEASGETGSYGFLMSLAKPVLIFGLVWFWAFAAGFMDKDAGFYYLPRKAWAWAHMAAGAAGMAVVLLTPIFWLGYPLAALVIVGEAVGYATVRNKKAPADARWTLNLDSFRQQMEQRKEKSAVKRSSVKVLDAKGSVVAPPAANEPGVDAWEKMAEVVEFALPRSAERVDLAAEKEKAQFSARVDGVRFPLEAPPPKEAVAVMELIKKLAGLDVDERRRQQVGKMSVELDEYGEHKVRVRSQGSSRGMQVTLEFDPPTEFRFEVGTLGFHKKQLALLQPALDEDGGVVLVASPARHGQTTACLAMLAQHDAYTSSVLTFEPEGEKEFELEGVGHRTYDASIGDEQRNTEMSSLLRTDPNAVYLARLADKKSADLAARSAEDVRFYLPVRANDSMSAIRSWVQVVGDKPRAAESLRAVVTCRLVRRLCQTCRASYTPDPAAIKKMGLPKNTQQLYRASGKVVVKDKEQVCPACHGIGYRGRVGVYEVAVIDASARGYLGSGEADHLRSHLRKAGMMSLQEAGLAKVLSGDTDIRELTRVISGDGAGKSSRSSKSSSKAKSG